MAVQVFWPDSWSVVGFGLAVDGFFALYYMIWLMAAGLTPHRPMISSIANSIRRLRSAGSLVLLLGLAVYFLLVPTRFENPGPEFEAWAPSLFLFVIFDLMVFSRLLTFSLQAESQRWKVLLKWLAAAHLMNGYLDLQEGLIYLGVFEWPSSRLDIVWSIPLLLVAATARLRNYPFAATEEAHTQEFSELQLGRQSPLVFFVVFLPFLHLTLYRLDLLNEAFRAPRESVVMVCTLLLLAAVLVESNLLFRSLREAALQRRELQDLRVAQEVAERSERARNRFLANVSHEIRTPMNGILGIADMLLAGRLSHEDQHRVGMLRSSARGLLQIIDDILDFTKIDADDLTVEQQRFELRSPLDQVVGLQKRSADLKSLSLHLVVDEQLPRWVVGDPNRLRQVLTNLIANAIKFTHSGTVMVSVSPADPDIRFEVRDSGIGIAEQDHERLFEPFTQVDGSRSRKYGGAGLGLAICRQIVTRQGGEIGVESQLGQGACFWFTLPLREARPPSRRKVDAEDPEWSQKPRVLLAEDNAINQMVAIHQLEDLGVEVDVAANGQEILEALEEGVPDLILMDCQMPLMDGYEATQRIRQREEGTDSHVPIVAVTAHAFSDDRDRCMDAGMDDYLPKPYTRADLAALLKRWLGPDASGLDDSWIESPPSNSAL